MMRDALDYEISTVHGVSQNTLSTSRYLGAFSLLEMPHYGSLSATQCL